MGRVTIWVEGGGEKDDLGTEDGHSYTFPLLWLCTKDAPVVRSFTRKKSGKNSIEVLLIEQNWETERRLFLMLGAHKILLCLKVESHDLRVVNPIWVIGTLLPSPTIMSSLPPYPEWTERFCMSEVMWWEAPESTIHPDGLRGASRFV